jgi:hypothetical protein
LLLVCTSLNCAHTGNLSSNAVSHKIIAFSNWRISKSVVIMKESIRHLVSLSCKPLAVAFDA